MFLNWAAKIRRNADLVLGVVIVLSVFLTGLIGPYIIKTDPLEQDLYQRLRGPSPQHLFGTDALGRDMLSRVIWGSRISVLVALGATAVAVLLGGSIGVVAGFFGGVVDAIAMRLVDVLLAFPGMIAAVFVVSILGTGVVSAMVATGVVGVATFARTARASVLSIRESAYFEAARALGMSNSRIILKHVLPNAISPILVLAAVNIGSAILIVAGLGFLGLGVQPPTPEWGAMISEGRVYMRLAPHVIYFPGLCILIAVLGFNLLGDGLRDYLDPHLKVRR